MSSPEGISDDREGGMGDEQAVPGPDLALGIPSDRLADGSAIKGHVGGEEVLLVRRGEEFFAIGAACTHYGGPLAEGLIVGETIRCPWHHACFDLRSGAVLRAPALDPLPCWRVERRDGMIHVLEKRNRAPAAPAFGPASVVILGGGAAGNAAAETLRAQGYRGPIVIISADDAAPYDRPNLSKDYLAGEAPDEWIPLRPPEFYDSHGIELRLGTRVIAIDPDVRHLRLSDGTTVPFDGLLLATGAEPRRLDVPGHDRPHVHYLRSLADCRRIIEGAEDARRVLVVGASFIGLEVAASLRNRGLDVHVVAPEARPMERVLGEALGDHIRRLHERNGVVFHLGKTVTAIGQDEVTIEAGERIAADLVLVGIGVRPAIDLAEAAGLAVDGGVLVNEFLETSVPGIFAAGDIARWPDPLTGERIRVEHWVVAERQGQTAARNMLGLREPYRDIPFFWTRQYGRRISYVGYARQWDDIEIDGDIEAGDCRLAFRRAGRTLAIVTIGRDRESLEAEAAMEQTVGRV